MPSSRTKLPQQKDVRNAFAKTIEELRSERALSQERLAELAELSLSYVSLLERGQRSLTVYSAAKLASAFDVQTGELVARAEAYWKKQAR